MNNFIIVKLVVYIKKHVEILIIHITPSIHKIKLNLLFKREMLIQIHILYVLRNKHFMAIN